MGRAFATCACEDAEKAEGKGTELRREKLDNEKEQEEGDDGGGLRARGSCARREGLERARVDTQEDEPRDQSVRATLQSVLS